MKVSDYIADLLYKNGVKTVFSVVGGGAMHLNDSFGHHPGIKCIYNHHEQASAMAAESYARFNNEMAAVCVTTGPGGTNAITGVLCAWQDSIPMIVISGQVRYETTVESSGLHLRQYGEQEHYIVDTVSSMTKYAVLVKDVREVRYHIEKALYLAAHGRRGPCWADIPLDIQNADVNPEELKGFEPDRKKFSDHTILEKVRKIFSDARRPVIIAGSAVRTAGVYSEFREFIDKVQVPAVAATAIADLFPGKYPYYYGNFGMIGGRAGNFIVNNSDCLLVLGCRLAFKHTGFNYDTFANHAVIITVDIDKEEQKKSNVNRQYPVTMDIADFFAYFKHDPITADNMDSLWISYCNDAKIKFPVYQEKHKISDCVNPYFFAEALKKHQSGDSITVVGNACACDSTRQCGIDHEGQRLWGNTDCGTMGYDLPASVGAAVASGRTVCCVTGDGGIQMNIQELQTIVHNRLPVKIFVHANHGYFAIMQTHKNFFGRLSGCTKETGISMPDFERLAYAYGMPYYHLKNHEDVEKMLPGIMAQEGYCMCEIDSDTSQPIEPRSKSRVLADGTMESSAFDDLYPFLEREVYDLYADYCRWRKNYESV